MYKKCSSLHSMLIPSCHIMLEFTISPSNNPSHYTIMQHFIFLKAYLPHFLSILFLECQRYLDCKKWKLLRKINAYHRYLFNNERFHFIILLSNEYFTNRSFIITCQTSQNIHDVCNLTQFKKVSFIHGRRRVCRFCKSFKRFYILDDDET